MQKHTRLIILAAAIAYGCSGGSTAPGIGSLVVTGPSSNVIAGQTLQLSAIARDEAGDIVQTPALSWSSSAAGIATVSTQGLVTGKAPGTAMIRARAGTIRDSLEVTVTDNSADVFTPGEVFSPEQVSILVGGIVRFHIFGDEHDVTFATVNGAPASIPVTASQTVTRTFAVAGTFPYDCRVHPGMSGTVVVH